MATTLTPDICVIGAGSGGLTVAAAAATFGVPVVLIEKHEMGGDCLNTGCVPSKAILASAKRAQAFRTADIFGVRAAAPQIDFGKVMEHVRGVQAAIAPNDSEERFTALGVTVIRAAGQFTDANTVTAGDHTIRARRFVIATGSAAAVPPIPGLKDVPFLTNETIWGLETLPKHLAVIGAGPIGMEMAQAFRRLGAEVTVLEVFKPFAKDDPECARVVLDQIEREGVRVRAGIKVNGVRRDGDAIAIDIEDQGKAETVAASHLLVAAGRRPNVMGLGLEAAGIRHSPKGIEVDAGLRTSNKRVYAIGDATGGLMFTHVAGWHGSLVIRNALFRLPVKASPDLVPWVTYTDPELAHVGLGEEEAKKRHGDIRVLRWPFHENDRAQAEREVHGHIKVVTTKKGKILGATVVGHHAGEIINMWSLAVSQGMNIRAFTGFVSPYPTLAEVGKRAAVTYFTPSLTSPGVRRIIGWLRRLG